MSQRGFSQLPVIIALALGLGFGASVYLNFAQHQRAEQEQKLLKGEITDLRYQVNQDRQALAGASPSPSTSPLPLTDATPTPAPSATPAVAGTSSISIAQLGVKLTTVDPVGDLTYGMAQSAGFPVAALTTQSLVAKYTGCKPSNANNVLGFIVRKTSDKSTGTLIKKLGEWNYFYLKPSGYCTADAAGRNTLAAGRAAVQNSVIPSLSN